MPRHEKTISFLLGTSPFPPLGIGLPGLETFRGFPGGFPSIGSSIRVRLAPRADLPPPPPAPKVEPVPFHKDLIKNIVGGITGGGNVRDINAQEGDDSFSNILNDIILGATTSRQERAVLGTPRAGDFVKTLIRDVRRPVDGRIGPGSIFGARGNLIPPPFGGIPEIANLVVQNVLRGTQGFTGDRPMANGLSLVGGSACPPGPQSFPAGTCLLDFQWEDAGGPRGFEMIGRNEDGRAVLRKRGRRRRRHGLTKSQMGQVSWACNLPPNCRKEVLHGIVHG